MRFKSINIMNFRHIRKLSLIPNVATNILVGENNVGKSSVFLAFEKLLERVSPGSEGDLYDTDCSFGERAHMSLRYCLELTSEEQKRFIDIILSSPDNNIREAAHRLLSPELSSIELFYDKDDMDEKAYIKFSSFFVDNSGIYHGKYDDNVQMMSRFEKDLLVHSSLDTLPWRKWNFPDSFNKISRGLIRNKFRKFADFRSKPSLCKRDASNSGLQGSDTANTLLNLKNSQILAERSRYKSICAEFHHFFPNIQIEAVETQLEKHADVHFVQADPSFAVPLSNIGSGAAELLTLLTNLVALVDHILVVEEPELHLHPHLRKRLLKLLIESSRNNQIFIITHDPLFVASNLPESIVRLTIENASVKYYQMPKTLDAKNKGQIVTALRDDSKREMIFARSVLLVEDESQQRFVSGCAKRLDIDLTENGVSVIPVDGEDSYKPYITLLNYLGIKYLCLRDKSWGSPERDFPTQYKSLKCELEEFLEKENLSDVLVMARKHIGTGKARVAKYVAETIEINRIPTFFVQLIEDIVKLSKL